MKGGYIIVDCTGLDLTSAVSQSIPGIWEKAKTAISSGKPIVAHNCVYGSGVAVSPVTCFGWNISANEIVIVGATLHIHVKNDDTAIVVDVAPSNVAKSKK